MNSGLRGVATVGEPRFAQKPSREKKPRSPPRVPQPRSPQTHTVFDNLRPRDGVALTLTKDRQVLSRPARRWWNLLGWLLRSRGWGVCVFLLPRPGRSRRGPIPHRAYEVLGNILPDILQELAFQRFTPTSAHLRGAQLASRIKEKGNALRSA